MSMNKKINLILTFIISLLLINTSVYAKCSDVYNLSPYPSEEQCEKFSEDNFKCKGNGYTNGTVPKLRCEKSNECIDGFTNQNGTCIQNSSNNNGNDSNNGNNPNGGTGITNDDTKIKCNTLTDKTACGVYGKCNWNEVESKCQEDYIAEMPCDEEEIKIALSFFGYLLMIARLAIPLIIIVMGTIDLFKSVVDKDEKSFTKQIKILLIRIVAGVFVFFIPTLIYALFSISSNLNIVNESKYKTCVDCLLKPTECKTSNKTNNN